MIVFIVVEEIQIAVSSSMTYCLYMPQARRKNQVRILLANYARSDLFVPSRIAFVDGKYYCRSCKFPSCKVCGRMRSTPKPSQRFLEYTCENCIVRASMSAVQNASFQRQPVN